jgi:O-antigen ligase
MASGTGSFFAPHSQILQAWFEGGILGAAFFIVLLWQLLTGLHVTIMSRTYDALSAVFAYVLLLQLWDLFMSPFGGDHRMEIAMAVVAVVLLRIHWPERRQVRSTKPDRIRVDPVAPNSAVRQLRGAVVR